MSSRSFILLLIVLAFFVFGTIIFGGGKTSNVDPNKVEKLLSDIDLGEVKSLVVSKGEETVTLEIVDDRWTVKEMFGYAADFPRIKSNLLSLFSLSTTPSITSTEDDFAKLGVSKDSVTKESESMKVNLGLGEKKGVDLYIGSVAGEAEGEAEKGLAKDEHLLRREGWNKVIMLKDPLLMSANPEEWIQKSLIDLPEQMIWKISQYSADDESKSTLDIVRDDKGELALSKDFNVDGREVKELVFSQLKNLLQQLNISTVTPVSEFKEEEASFKGVTEIFISDGRKYSVKRFVKDFEGQGKYYLKLSLMSDETQTENIKKAKEEKKITLTKGVSAEEIQKENSSYSNWVYEVPNYIYERLDVTLGALVDEGDSNPEAETGSVSAVES